MRNAYKILPLGRLIHIWKDNISLDLRQTGWEGVDWMHLTQDGDQWQALVNHNQPSGSIKGR
jgi:hypothetical protein